MTKLYTENGPHPEGTGMLSKGFKLSRRMPRLNNGGFKTSSYRDRVREEKRRGRIRGSLGIQGKHSQDFSESELGIRAGRQADRVRAVFGV